MSQMRSSIQLKFSVPTWLMSEADLCKQINTLDATKLQLIVIIIEKLNTLDVRNPDEVIRAELSDPKYTAIRNDEDLQRVAVNLKLVYERKRKLWLTEYKLPVQNKPSLLYKTKIQPQYDGSLLIGNHDVLYQEKDKKESFQVADLKNGVYSEDKISLTHMRGNRIEFICRLNESQYGMVVYDKFADKEEYYFQTAIRTEDKYFAVDDTHTKLFPKSLAYPIITNIQHYPKINCLAYSFCDVHEETDYDPSIYFIDLTTYKVFSFNIVWDDFEFHALKHNKCFEIFVKDYSRSWIYEIDIEANSYKKMTEYKFFGKRRPYSVHGYSPSTSGEEKYVAIKQIDHFPHARTTELKFFEYNNFTLETIVSFPSSCALSINWIQNRWIYGGYPNVYTFDPRTLAQHDLGPLVPNIVCKALQSGYYVVQKDEIDYCEYTESLHKPYTPPLLQIALLRELSGVSLDVIKIMMSYIFCNTDSLKMFYSVNEARLVYKPPMIFSVEFCRQFADLNFTFQSKAANERKEEYIDVEARNNLALLVAFTKEINQLTYDDLTIKKVNEIANKAINARKKDSDKAKELITKAVADLQKNPKPLNDLRNCFRLFSEEKKSINILVIDDSSPRCVSAINH